MIINAEEYSFVCVLKSTSRVLHAVCVMSSREGECDYALHAANSNGGVAACQVWVEDVIILIIFLAELFEYYN